MVIILVGSAPVPTFSRHAYESQFNNKGSAPKSVIDCAAEIGVKKIVLMSAKLPFFLKTKHFAYSRGKDLALESAQKFAELSQQHSAIVLQPGTLLGKRHLKNGKVLHLDTLLSPFSKVLPSQFTSVHNISEKIANAIQNENQYGGKFTLIKYPDI